ncbi:MAG: peptidoglycan-binding protein, partial [Armatimonadetes bacterium]|nr:peptidoglycan-binding protein [Anaerolineae bacterium]
PTVTPSATPTLESTPVPGDNTNPTPEGTQETTP